MHPLQGLGANFNIMIGSRNSYSMQKGIIRGSIQFTG